MAYRVFVSHGSSDRLIADRIIRSEIEAAGASVFLDTVELTYGDEFRDRIFSEIRAANELLVLLTQSSIRRPWIFAEIGAMIALDKRVVALNYGVTDAELDRLGIKTILGPSLIGMLDDIDFYIAQLKTRIGG